MNLYIFLLCHLFKVEYIFNLLKRFYQPNYLFPKSRHNINRDFPQELRWWQRYLEILIISTNSVYQINFGWSQASCPIGAKPASRPNFAEVLRTT